MIDRMIMTPHRRLDPTRKQSALSDPLNIMEVEEDEDLAKAKLENQLKDELVRDLTSMSLPTTKKEVIIS